MALPKLTAEQTADALAKAAAVRKARSELKAKLKRGELTVTDVLGDAANDVVGKMKVAQVLTALPGIGKARAQQLMERIGIDENRRVRGLGVNQRAALEAEFAA